MLNSKDEAERSVGTVDEQAILERILTAVMEQQLSPGTKLGEATLCATFGVGRMRIRRALLLLANQGVVVLHSNRGAFIASPSQTEARDVFEARKGIEPSVVRLAVQRATASDIAGLEEHLRLEDAAHRERNRRDAIRLSGEFHVRLAAVTGNAVMSRMVRELVARTSLIIGLFGASGLSNCREEEHAGILTAIKQKDTELAVARAREHLDHIEAELDLTTGPKDQIDLQAILQD
jgi:DNA-binding GntR family transcriptional regulator